MPLDQTHSPCRTIEAAFLLHGAHLPANHRAALYAALCELPDLGTWLADADEIAIAPIAGRAQPNGLLALTTESRLLLRLPADELPRVLGLAGHPLMVGAHGLDIGQPLIQLTRPATTLHSNLVVFDDCSKPETAASAPAASAAAEAADAFITEVDRQLAALEIAAEPILGGAGNLHLPQRALSGFALTITGLAPDDSIHLQEAGLGDHRKLGCGVFLPG
ncbi:MAG: type I-MYXAN CRISPR-associated protein Cas6/Cmx6 [Thiohalocapsa sp.]|jgi:CRISPR-associated protein Cas6|uniref:type I-MYXAN CRISPR-associated protein Cas6/Cmx6 n=1 Tax=Thiohalocapsa sp. TaxID=2497641 RepID=UPI0025DC6942|nr:type I-MYXAN CRISPR-associated protein Cas6/Cmx6 [Thiohalocapsa sp.]MCG6943678.1 type I-MYXAN CRISPR-associated protein Cas6/Cmx6 [Thiohalocapsa sp.]